MNIATKKKLVDNGAKSLGRRSMRMKAVGVRNRERFAAAFVDTMEAKGGVAMFRRKSAEYGISIVLIGLLLNIAWTILWHWWTNREDA